VKKLWQKYADRIDGTSLRERALIFFAAAFVTVAMIQVFLVAPMQEKQRRLTRDLGQSQSQIRAFSEQTQSLVRSRAEDPDVQNRRKLEQLKRRLGELERAMQGQQVRFIDPRRIAGLLEELLTRNRRLQLVGLKSLPVSNLMRSDAASAAADAKTAKPAAERAIYKHGVELTVKGPYLDLLAYLRELEHLPVQMFWSRMDLTAGEYPDSTLKLVVFTLSLDPAWMVV
jgi:MSHA biogenesis protein MshJ